MRKFLLKLTVLIIALIVISAGIEFLLLHKTNIYSYKHHYIISHYDDISVLLIGNSHIAMGLIPDSIKPGVFNAAIVCRPVEYDVALAQQYIPHMNGLQAVVMSLNYNDFSFGRDVNTIRNFTPVTPMGNTFKCMYYKYMNIHDDIWYWPELLNSKLDYMSRFWKNEEELRECDILGYTASELSKRVPGWEYKSIPKLIDVKNKKNENQYKELYDSYCAIAHVALSKNARLVLLGTPIYKTAHPYILPEVQKEIREFVEKLQQEYENVDYYDYSLDNRFGHDDFCDATHLTDIGAAKFSKLVRELL